MEVTQLESYTDFSKLFELFEKHASSLYYKYPKDTRSGANNRYGFPKYRGAVYGISKDRGTKKFMLSYKSKKFPAIYEELQRIGKKFVHLNIQLYKSIETLYVLNMLIRPM